MTNSNDLIKIYCTRPSCDDRVNYISQDKITSGCQRSCSNCNMPLILLQYFLPIKLLVPDEERFKRGGGFGRTFLAKDLRSPNKTCIIKQLHPLQQSELQRIEGLFKQEAEVLNKLAHNQIPKALAFDLVTAPPSSQNQSGSTSKNQQIFFYLVQEFIEGKNLAEELETKGKFSEEEVIDFLLQILKVLDYIHNFRKFGDGIIHRDIKPHNIIFRDSDRKFCLIDFGSVKQVVKGVPTNSSCVLGTKDYAAPEQWAGEEVFYSSDLYSLAATCVCLLTGKNPQDLRHGNRWVWKQDAKPKNDRLANILDLMLSPEPTVRPQSAQDAIKALAQEQKEQTQEPTKIILEKGSKQNTVSAKYAFIPVVLCCVFGVIWWLSSSNSPLCISNENFSCGEKEKRLIPLESTDQEKIQSQYFKNGLKAFQARNYPQAILDLEKHLSRHKNDPEARIIYNNAKAANSRKFVKIAVCLPINGQINSDTHFRNYSDGIAEQILRGVALVQENINHNATAQNLIQGDKMLLIELCDDDDDKDRANKVANILENDSSITGVIGHYTSPTTLAAGLVYNKNQIPAISPTSTAVRDDNFQLGDYVFRVSADDSYAAEKLVSHITENNLSPVAIIYDSKNNFNRSLSDQFRQKLNFPQEIVSDCDISKTKISVCVQEARKKNAKVMLLAITNKVVEESPDVSNLISNPGNMVLVGSSSLYTGRFRSINLQNKLIMAVQWHRGGENSDFKKHSGDLWGTQNINLRTAMGYEAAQAMVQGLRNIPQDINITRQELYKALKNLKVTDRYPAKGAIVNVEFDERSDRKVDGTNKDKLMFIVTPQYNPAIQEDDFLPPNNTTSPQPTETPVNLSPSTQ